MSAIRFNTILAVESSCDETAVAVCSGGKILSNMIASQHVHAVWGGVVPEIAAREHLRALMPTFLEALKQSKLTIDQINAFAYTNEPGLVGCLLVGQCFCEALSVAYDKPLVSVNHTRAHVFSNFIDEPYPDFPFLCMSVSGGHTQIILTESPHTFTVVGQTVDDAAGEAFDKIGKMIGLPYPAGKSVDELAQTGNPDAFRFPHPKVAGFDFSFSGLKTAVLYFLQDQSKRQPQFIQQYRADICASVRKVIIDILMNTFARAQQRYPEATIGICGGVGANTLLRREFEQFARDRGKYPFMPPAQYCTDNAAMVATMAYWQYARPSCPS